jgi:hypothetical protein
LKSVQSEQLDILPSSAKEELQALGRLVRQAEQSLRYREDPGAIHRLFPEFNTTGFNLWEALKATAVADPEPLSWANSAPAKRISDTIFDDLIDEWIPGFGSLQSAIRWLENAIAWLRQRLQTGVVSWATMDKQVKQIAEKAWGIACDRSCPPTILERTNPTKPNNAVNCRQVLSHLEELKQWFTEQIAGAHTDNRSDQGKPEHPQEVNAAPLESALPNSGFITFKSLTSNQDGAEQPRGTADADQDERENVEVQTPAPGQGGTGGAEGDDAGRGTRQTERDDRTLRTDLPIGSIPKMGVKAKDVLMAMLELRAFDFDSRTNQEAVVIHINRTHQVTSYRRAFKMLSDKGWKQGEPGRGRGIWLTTEGRQVAEAIRQKDAEEK